MTPLLIAISQKRLRAVLLLALSVSMSQVTMSRAGAAMSVKPGVTGSLLILAQRRDDPSAPVFPTQPKRRKSDPVVSVPPFALPTAPVVTAPPADGATGEDGEPLVPPEAATVPPYHQEALRLAQLLGSLHYLRPLCGAEDGQIWREQMEQLIAAGPSNEQWRAQLIHSFNRGYRTFERTYRVCTDPAVTASKLYMSEGHDLVQLIKTRYTD